MVAVKRKKKLNNKKEIIKKMGAHITILSIGFLSAVKVRLAIIFHDLWLMFLHYGGNMMTTTTMTLLKN